MNSNQYTQYLFSNEHGVTGTLADNPKFAQTAEGEEYAKLAVYCKSMDRANRPLPDTRELPLIAYIRVFDPTLLSKVETLKKGYFVNFKYDHVIFSVSENKDTHEIRINALLTATAFEIRHVPNDKAGATSTNRQNAHANNNDVIDI